MNIQYKKILPLVITLAGLTLASAVVRATDAAPAIPKPADPYQGYTATRLRDGRWLIAGGIKHQTSGFVREPDGKVKLWSKGGYTAEASLYDPKTGTWTNTGSMNEKRAWHAATLLSDGRVLVVGGQAGGNHSQLSSAEIYDPVTGTWTTTGSMNVARHAGFRATLLADGRVLVTGGTTNSNPRSVISSAELFDATTGKWVMTNPMNVARYGHAATLLANGLVLVAGGKNSHGNWLFSAELFNPATGKWTMTGSLPYQSRFNYTGSLLTNGQVLLVASGADYAWELTNAWEVSKVLYDPASRKWTAIGPRRPHFVSSTNLDRTLTISPESGSSFLASAEIEIMVQSADRFGVTNIQLFRDNVEMGQGEESPFRYTVTNLASGTYVFSARAAFANGLASTSAPVSITFKAPGPRVTLKPGPTEFITETHVKTSPAILLASVVGVNPGALTRLTLNGVAQPLRTGNFVLHPSLNQGRNVFVLVATDNKGRTGKAVTDVYLNSSVPAISIKDPSNGVSIDAACVDVLGTFNTKDLKRITVGSLQAPMAMPASVSGNTFEARNVFLAPGTNTIVAVAENLAGNKGTNAITIIGPAHTQREPILPVQVQLTPIGGFAPLPVTFAVRAHVPGKIQKVFYDFDGDNHPDQTASDLRPVTHTYKAAGEYFPVVTVQTTVGRFSSLSGTLGMFAAAFGQGNALASVNVQMPPVLLGTIKITDPVDVKWTTTSNLYVLSGSTATITEFDAHGKLIRSLGKIGSKPSGFDVDTAGNVYVAMTGNNQVWKFKPTADAFEPDASFGNGGFIGNREGKAGTNASEFNAPYDVAISRDGKTITVSDSGNHRILQFAENGASRGGDERGIGSQFKNPAGLAYDELGTYLFVVDSGNNRIALASGFMSIGTSGTNGVALGQFNGATHLSANERGLYVADTGNNRVQVFSPVEGGEMHSPVPFHPRIALAGELGLNHPQSVAAVDDFLEEKCYIADTGNNRVLLVKLPSDNPETVWKHMIACLKAGDIPGAMSDFSITSKDKYQESYQALTRDELLSTIKDMENIKPATIESDHAQYYFESVVQGQKLTFPVEFDKEFGKWKIMEY